MVSRWKEACYAARTAMPLMEKMKKERQMLLVQKGTQGGNHTENRNMYRYQEQHFLNIIKMTILIPVLHLLTVCGAVTQAIPGTITTVAVGDEVHFSVNNQGRDQDEVTFRIKFPVTTKIVGWTSEKSHSIHPLYKDRIQIQGGSFVILYNVQVNDTGEYEIEFNYYRTELVSSNRNIFKLHVFEPVSQPVAVIIGNCSTPNITLSCSVSKGTNVTFYWQKYHLPGASNRIHNGAILVINHVNEEEQRAYRCVTENPVSNATSNPVITELCNGNDPKGTDLWVVMLIRSMVIFIMASASAAVFCNIWRRQNQQISVGEDFQLAPKTGAKWAG
ncbi:SLAM family member 7-like [Heptranchias perlo]|uniref:SLAM family member 7-like n=1 Tax=Heptranchias perlo TaxID=212740 RepID=UPI0035597C9D